MQGWLFVHSDNFWINERIEAFVTSVPIVNISLKRFIGIPELHMQTIVILTYSIILCFWYVGKNDYPRSSIGAISPIRQTGLLLRAAVYLVHAAQFRRYARNVRICWHYKPSIFLFYIFNRKMCNQFLVYRLYILVYLIV